MSIFMQTSHGDVVVDLHTTQHRQQPQMVNLLELCTIQYFNKLSFFTAPELHISYPTNSFLFFGDSTYTGKGGQSVYNLLSYADPTHAHASRMTSTSPFKTDTTTAASFTAQQLQIQKRREFLQKLWQDRQPVAAMHDGDAGKEGIEREIEVESKNQILLLSIPQYSGDITSIYAFYFIQDMDTVDSLAEGLREYIIGHVVEGFSVLSHLLRLSPTSHTIIQQLTETPNSPFHMQRKMTPFQTTIQQTATLFYPFSSKINIPSSLVFIFPHQQLKRPLLHRDQQDQFQFNITTQTRSNPAQTTTDSFDHQLLMYSSDFDYIPITDNAMDTERDAEENAEIQLLFQPPNNVLFISNLHSNTTESELIDLISPFSTVLKCNVLKEKLQGNADRSPVGGVSTQLWKCYAFVELSHASHCDLVIKQCDGKQLHNHTIHVDFCHSGASIERSMYFKVHLSNPYFAVRGNKGRATLTSTIVGPKQ